MGGGAMPAPIAGGVEAGFGGATTTTNLRSVSHHPSSSSSSLSKLPGSANHTSRSSQSFTNKFDGTAASGSNHGPVSGPVPSRTEVEKAISDLQRFMLGFYSPELEWVQQMLNLHNPRMLKSVGFGRVEEAFRLLQTDPMVQRMVLSISTDRAVWEAILNNTAIQNLSAANQEMPSGSTREESDLATLIVKWILEIAMGKVMELIEQFSSLVNIIFQTPGEKKKLAAESTGIHLDDTSIELDNKLRSSLLLSVIILFIVVLTRANGLSV